MTDGVPTPLQAVVAPHRHVMAASIPVRRRGGITLPRLEVVPLWGPVAVDDPDRYGHDEADEEDAHCQIEDGHGPFDRLIC
jgi:hypothetical protein